MIYMPTYADMSAKPTDADALASIFDAMREKYGAATVELSEPTAEMAGVTLNDGQADALAEILASYDGFKRRHLLTGYADASGGAGAQGQAGECGGDGTDA